MCNASIRSVPCKLALHLCKPGVTATSPHAPAGASRWHHACSPLNDGRRPFAAPPGSASPKSSPTMRTNRYTQVQEELYAELPVQLFEERVEEQVEEPAEDDDADDEDA